MDQPTGHEDPDYEAQVNSRSIEAPPPPPPPPSASEGPPDSQVQVDTRQQAAASQSTLAASIAAVAHRVNKLGDGDDDFVAQDSRGPSSFNAVEAEPSPVPHGLLFKHQVRCMTSEEVEAEQVRLSDKYCRDQPSLDHEVEEEKEEIPTVPAVRVGGNEDGAAFGWRQQGATIGSDSAIPLTVSHEGPTDSAIQLSYEGPTEDEVRLLRRTVAELQNRLREQDEAIRKLRTSLDEMAPPERTADPAGDAAAVGTAASPKPIPGAEASERRGSRRALRSLLVVGGLLCVGAIIVGVVVGTSRGGTASEQSDTPETINTDIDVSVPTLAPNFSGLFNTTETTEVPVPTLAPNGLADSAIQPTDAPHRAEDLTTRRSSGIVAMIAILGFLGLLAVGWLVRFYLRKRVAVTKTEPPVPGVGREPATAAKEEDIAEAEADEQHAHQQLLLHQSTAAALQAKLADRSATAQQLEAVLHKLDRFDFEC